MSIRSRLAANNAFTLLALFSVLIVVTSLVVLLLPMFWRGVGAVAFRGTVEFREMQLREYSRGDAKEVHAQVVQARKAREPVYEMMDEFGLVIDPTPLQDEAKSIFRAFKGEVDGKPGYWELREAGNELRDALLEAMETRDKATAVMQLDKVLLAQNDPRFASTSAMRFFDLARHYRIAIDAADPARRSEYAKSFADVQKYIGLLLGPRNDADLASLPPEFRYGALRSDMAGRFLKDLLWQTTYVDAGDGTMAKPVTIPRAEQFKGTKLEGLFPYVRDHLDEMLLPRGTFYWQYFVDGSSQGHYYGGVGPEIVGTLLLTVLAVGFSLPLGVIAAGYLVEVSGDGVIVRIIRTCINTLAGVPSIVFGLFGLAFFVIYLLPKLHMGNGMSILAGAMTLSLLVLPVIIRASEEAIRSVPHTYREAALGLGASRFRCFVTVTLPAALPGILTGVILAMSRAAGETAPILFTAGVPMLAGGAMPTSLFGPTPTLSYSSYDIAVGDRLSPLVPHQQWGMIMTLVLLVLLLNALAIVLRWKVSRRLRGN